MLDFARHLGPEGQLAFSAGGIYSSYLYYGVLQERIYRPDPNTGDLFTFTLFLLSVQCLFNFALAALANYFSGGGNTVRKNIADNATTSPFSALGLHGHNGTHWIALISLSYLGAMAFSNQSLQFVSYPFQAISKSCKMVPVMLANVFVGGKRYSLLEYSTTLAITLGVVIFQLSGSKASFLEGNPAWGVLLLIGSLFLDGFTGSNQRLLSNEFKPTSHYLMMSLNLWALLYLSVALIVTGEGVAGATYVFHHQQTLIDIVAFSVCSAIGQQFVFFCIVGPGPLACTTITTTRKFFTVLISVIWYPDNRLSGKQYIAVGLVFGGLVIELLEKRRISKQYSVEKNLITEETKLTGPKSS